METPKNILNCIKLSTEVSENQTDYMNSIQAYLDEVSETVNTMANENLVLSETAREMALDFTNTVTVLLESIKDFSAARNAFLKQVAEEVQSKLTDITE